MIRLIINLYDEKTINRKQEQIDCLRINIKNNLINQILILNEGLKISEINHQKIINIDLTKRPDYNTFFNIVNTYTKINDINIISNNDIYFDDSLQKLKNLDFSNTCLALTRWNLYPSGKIKIHKGINSQDCWIFKGKIENVSGNFFLGLPGCDGKIAFEMVQAGYKVYNPSYDIKTYHLHQSDIRNYDTQLHKIPPPHYYSNFISLKSIPRTILYRFMHSWQYLKYCYKYSERFKFFRKMILSSKIKI